MKKCLQRRLEMNVIFSYTMRGASLQSRHMLWQQKAFSSSEMIYCLDIEKA